MEHRLQFLDQVGGRNGQQLLFGKDMAYRRIRPVGRVRNQGRNVFALIALVVMTEFEDIAFHALQSHFVRLAVFDQVFEQRDGLFHIFGQAAQTHVNAFVRRVHTITAGDFIEFLTDFGRTEFGGAQIFEIRSRQAVQQIVVIAHFEQVRQFERRVLGVVHVVEIDFLTDFRRLDVFGIIDKLRFDRFHLRGGGLKVCQEPGFHVTVDDNGRNGRLLHLVDVGRFALTFVNDHIVARQKFGGEFHDIFLRHFRQFVNIIDGFAPRRAFHIGIRDFHAAALVGLQLLVHFVLLVVDRGGQHPVGEITVLDAVQAFEHQVFHFFQRLTRFRHAAQRENAAIHQRAGVSVGEHDFLRLVQIQVVQTGLAVVQHIGHEVAQHGFFGRGTAHRETDGHTFGFKTDEFLFYRCLQRRFLFKRKLGHVFGFQAAEIFFDNRHGFLRVEIAGKHDGHIVGHVIGLIERLDVFERGVFQMFAQTEHVMDAVRMVREQGFHHNLAYTTAVVRQRHVLFFINGLYFRMEQTEHHVLEPFGLNLRPVFQLVGRHVLNINREVVRRTGIGPRRTDARHQFVVFVRDGQLGGFVRQTVDNVIGGGAFGRIGQVAIDFKLIGNGLQQDVFLFEIHRTEMRGTLEHHVFEIVGQPRGFQRIVLGTDFYGNISLNTRFGLIDTQKYLQTVRQRVHLHLQRVVLHGRELIVARGLRLQTAPESNAQDAEQQLPYLFYFAHDDFIVNVL